VTLVFTGYPANQIGTLTFQGGSTTTLNAPYTNQYKAGFDGVLMYVDQNAPLNSKVTFQGGSNTNLTGGLFFPSVEVDYTGSTVASASNCTELVGDYIQINGNASYNTTFTTSGCAADNTPTTQTAVGSKPTLVE